MDEGLIALEGVMMANTDAGYMRYESDSEDEKGRKDDVAVDD